MTAERCIRASPELNQTNGFFVALFTRKEVDIDTNDNIVRLDQDNVHDEISHDEISHNTTNPLKRKNRKKSNKKSKKKKLNMVSTNSTKLENENHVKHEDCVDSFDGKCDVQKKTKKRKKKKPKPVVSSL